ncbi:MAG: tRNA (5-methylaminomethyl-2-thiouridine)(34)-methyltransferase MnmD [Gammaproteobacteria bacterium]|nr:tRNA (5-methylaminomethyl-2-thiouridine)(34)-methyltransferase MnmD [Gammaproteobacteria bacterium]
MDTEPGASFGLCVESVAATVATMIKAAQLAWHDGQPYSKNYADMYHAEDGPREVERFFIGPAGLAELARVRDRIMVGELGFGTGLNFVVTAEACLRAGCRLHFMSFEDAPIAPADFSALANKRSANHPMYAELAAHYPPLIEGWHRRYFAEGKITLSVYWGDAATGLKDLAGRQRRPFDVWYLDGFDPRRNPELWSHALFNQLASLSRADTGVATFTSAGHVRRGLQEAGFSMRRVDQRAHGRKRETLAGNFSGKALLTPRQPEKVTVLGAGLAGASIARHLAELGVNVCVHHAPSIEGASAIPTMVLHGRLLGDDSAAAALRCHAYLYSTSYSHDRPGVRPSGALQLPGPNMTPAKLEKIATRYAASGSWMQPLTANAASDLANWPITDSAVSFPSASIVDAQAFCTHLLTHPFIELRPSEPLIEAPAYPCVLACGYGIQKFAAARYLEIAAVHGQLDFVTTNIQPRLPLLGNGYLAPDGERLAVGATYEYRPWSKERATRTNLDRLGNLEYRWHGRARGQRCIASDKTPVAGLLYADDGTELPDYYVSTAHGSMGTVTSHFAAALVAGQILGECPPMTREIEASMSSLRFRERQARRGYRHGAQM